MSMLMASSSCPSDVSCLLVVVLVCFAKDVTTQGTIAVVGSVDGTAGSGLPQPGDTSFLLQPIPVSGVVFAISAYFVAQTNSTFQIWRPVGNSTADTTSNSQPFRLTWQMTATPTVSKAREDIYMDAKFVTSCAVVRPGDWFGVVQPSAPAAIGAPFVASTPGRLPKMNEGNAGSGFVVGMQATFDMTFYYPYRLLAAAYVFIGQFGANASVPDASSETTTCPSDLLVPRWANASSTTTTPATVVTFLGGDTGATGETGQRGPYGATGSTGMRGPIGVIGTTGETGLPGKPGDTGSTGSTGSTGPQGPKGVHGQPGVVGPPGPDGEIGQPGPVGPPGNDTYQYNIQPNPAASQSEDTMSDGYLADQPGLRMGAIIWLAILSAMVVVCSILLLFVCYFVADDRRIQRNEAAWSGPELKRRR